MNDLIAKALILELGRCTEALRGLEMSVTTLCASVQDLTVCMDAIPQIEELEDADLIAGFSFEPDGSDESH